MKIDIRLKEDQLTIVAIELSFLLADEFVLFMKTKHAHWIFQGKDISGVLDFFEAQYMVFDEVADEVAERVRALDLHLPGTLKEYLELTCLSGWSNDDDYSNSLFRELHKDHETVINRLRNSIDMYLSEYDHADISAFILSVIKQHEKLSLMLRSRF